MRKNYLQINMMILLLGMFTACNGQHAPNKELTKPVSKKEEKKIVHMEKFDIKKYEERKKKDFSYEGYQKDDNLYIQQYNGIKEGYVEMEYDKSLVTEYIEELQYKNGHRIVRTYDLEGNIKQNREYFSIDMEVGKWRDFSPAGLVLKEEDKDENYKMSLDRILAFGRENHVDFGETGKVKRYRSPDTKKYVWELYWNTGKPGKASGEATFRTVIIDDLSGKVMADKEASSPLFLIRNADN
ncbi:hypothetical protein [Pedobacter caeni]|nr:hypothetical protein [Pedobacter caeni]